MSIFEQKAAKKHIFCTKIGINHKKIDKFVVFLKKQRYESVCVFLIFERENINMANPLDTKVISKLAEILDKSNLTELEYEDETCRICLTRDNRGAAAPVYAPVAQQAFAPAPAVSAVTPTASAAEASSSEDTDYSKHPGAIKSPMVGVVYLSADPNSPNYVKVGDTIAEGDTVCLIEAMKTFNPVKAHKGGKVVKILVSTGDPVEYGEPLVVVE